MLIEQAAQRLTPREIVALLASHQVLEERVEQLTRQLAWFKKQLFGTKSERRLIEASPDQLCLGEALARPDSATVAAASARPIAGYTRRAPVKASAEEAGDSGLKFDGTVPVEVIEVTDPAIEALPADQHEAIGEKVTYRLGQRPGSYVVLKYVRRVLKHKETGAIHCPPAPAGVFERCHADVSFLAGLLIDKFRSHLPLYRQHQRLTDAGIRVSRGWLTQLVHRTAALLEPIYEAQRRSILEGTVIAMDETPIKAGWKERGKLKSAYFWPLHGDRDEVLFPWRESRASPHVKELLGDYRGVLLTDGYAAYARYAASCASVVHAQCWAHARRQFVDAEGAEPQRVAQALTMIGALYAEERATREAPLTQQRTLQRRAERCRPIVEEFFAWCEEQLRDHALLPTNPFTQALGYARERRTQLSVFLADAHVPIDTNHLERAIRPLPMGRKNWLFCWTEAGAKYVGIVQSLLVTCRLHGVAPYDYLVDVLQRVDSHPASEVRLLTPRLWKEHFAHRRIRSALDPPRQ